MCECYRIVATVSTNILLAYIHILQIMLHYRHHVWSGCQLLKEVLCLPACPPARPLTTAVTTARAPPPPTDVCQTTISNLYRADPATDCYLALSELRGALTKMIIKKCQSGS